MRWVPPLFVTLTVVLSLAACGSDAGDPAPSSSTPEPASTAEVEIDGVAWTFTVDCAETGPDAVRVWGPGRHPETDEPSQLLIEATVPDPYIALTAGGSIIEASFESPLVLALTSDVITITDIDFVTDADLTTGEGTPAGTGRATVTCERYVEPPSD